MGLISRVSSRTYRLEDMNCQICNEKWSNYQCPKCTLKYCSIDCYKSPLHTKCADTFYKAQISSYLGDERMEDADEEISRMMMTHFGLKEQKELDDDAQSVSTTSSAIDMNDESRQESSRKVQFNIPKRHASASLPKNPKTEQKAVNDLPIQMNLP